MTITNVRVKLLKKRDGKLKAVASIVFDDVFVVHDIKVIETGEDCFVVMPSRKGPDGEYRDVAHPLNSEVRENIKSLIITEYKKLLEEEPVEEAQA
ncbi:MAG: septation regulator SpoVG [Clostridia bacterium]|nr:septation regulator SpoVG [Clostridia bacterium]